MSKNSDFTAAPSAVGYLYQARLALALCLKYAYAGKDISVAIERLDDVSFESNGSPIELLQSKHHIRRVADLGDFSPDLWKTLRVWCQAVSADPGLPSRTKLILFTTATAADGSVAQLLRPSHTGSTASGETARTVAERLTQIAETSRNLTLKPAFAEFLALPQSMRASLLSVVSVFDSQPTADELGANIENQIRMVAPKGRVSKAREMLEGWWWPRIIGALTKDPVESISVIEVETKIDEIREIFQRSSLIAEFENAEPPEDDLKNYEDLIFVRQLKAIGIGGNRIEYAKRDYYRAFAQRSAWTRQYVVLDGEISRFESTLIEEWEPRFESMCERYALAAADSLELREAGRDIYQWVETEARFPFRQLVKRFLNVGSYHILANSLRLGWHRDFTSHKEDNNK